MPYDCLLTLMRGDEPASTDEWWERLCVMQRGGSDMRYLPHSEIQLRQQVKALADAKLIILRDGKWEVVYREAEAERTLF